MSTARELPQAFSGFRQNVRYDLTSGLIVFLIALPLCLAISLASGMPATAGIFTAIIGGLLAPWISNSELTIKGPAAGLIVIVVGCVIEFGGVTGASEDAKFQAYRLALGVGVAAGVIQIIFALCRSGFIGELFPTSAVHGMLAAIGVIIMSKQIHVMLGVVPHAKEPLELLSEIPKSIALSNPEIAFIGLANLVLLFLWPQISVGWLKRIPGPLLVVLLSIPLSMYFDLSHKHAYLFAGREFTVGENYLVPVPHSLIAAITFPDFSGLQTVTGWKWVLMFTLIGTLESVLSTKAVDILDPWRRKTDINRDLLAIGLGNTLAAFVGGLPMISEIVRSKANIDNGGRTRFANMFHAIFLLCCVALLPGVLHLIPLAALAAVLVYTGFRLAHPREFVHMYKVGPEQLLIFSSTLIGVLATDLLIGVVIGIVVKLACNLFNGASFGNLFRAQIEVDEPDDHTTRVRVNHAAVFTNWLSLRRQIMAIDPDRTVMLDLSTTRLVDHTVMEKLHQLATDFLDADRYLLVVGLKGHQPLSSHPLAARKRLPENFEAYERVPTSAP